MNVLLSSFCVILLCRRISIFTGFCDLSPSRYKNRIGNAIKINLMHPLVCNSDYVFCRRYYLRLFSASSYLDLCVNAPYFLSVSVLPSTTQKAEASNFTLLRIFLRNLSLSPGSLEARTHIPRSILHSNTDLRDTLEGFIIRTILCEMVKLRRILHGPFVLSRHIFIINPNINSHSCWGCVPVCERTYVPQERDTNGYF